MTSAAGSSRTPSGTAAAPATRCTASAGCCAAAPTGSAMKARARLEAGLIAGDPDGEVTIAWTVAQQLMDLYQLDDPDQARRRAETLIADLRDCPIPELARLGRTLHAWRTELCAHFNDCRCRALMRVLPGAFPDRPVRHSATAAGTRPSPRPSPGRLKR